MKSGFGEQASRRGKRRSRKMFLNLPFDENTKEAVGKIIDRELTQRKILVREYMNVFPKGRKPHGERVILTPSYLLLCNGMGKVRAIPRDKIYWLCAQAGRKGSSSFIVRLLIFAENKLLYMEGRSVKHMEKIADKLYQYIPNVFEGENLYTLSYELEALFRRNRTLFLDVYENAKNNGGVHDGRAI